MDNETANHILELNQKLLAVSNSTLKLIENDTKILGYIEKLITRIENLENAVKLKE